MAVQAEDAITRLLPKVLTDPDLAPKLSEYDISEAELTTLLSEHEDELATATGDAQARWDSALALKESTQQLLFQQPDLPRTPTWVRALPRLIRLRLLRRWARRRTEVKGPDRATLATRLAELQKEVEQGEAEWWD